MDEDRPLSSCCALRLILRAQHGYPTHEGSRFTCAWCGQSYLREGWLWKRIDTADDIKDMVAHHPLSAENQKKDA